MIAWYEVFQVAHREQAFSEGVDSANGFSLLVWDKKTALSKRLTCLGGRLCCEVFQQPAGVLIDCRAHNTN